MTYNQLAENITKWLNEIKAYSHLALMALMMIAAHESMRGKYRRQMKADKPALSLWQIERPTFDTVVLYSARWPEYARRGGYVPSAVKFEDIEHDDKLACIVARARLSMDTKPLPKTPAAAAAYCKVFWNAGGKASAEKYLNDWLIWRGEDGTSI